MQASVFVSGDIVNTRNSFGNVVSSELEKIVKAADYSVCNFEAPVEGFGKPIAKSGSHIQNKAKTVKGLKEQGFNLFLLANNHMMDYGKDAMEATKRLAREEGLDTVGAGSSFDEAYKPLIKNINGLRFGIVNACEAQFGVLDYHCSPLSAGYAWINHNKIDKEVLKLKKICDFVLVFSHAGLENYSIPQKEWRERYRHLCDMGADVVIGSHPHVPQGYEKHNSSWIFYSLGNFYFDWGGHAEKSDPSFALYLTFKKNEPPSFRPIYHITNVVDKQVRLASEDEAVDVQELNDLLQAGYNEAHEEMTLDAYERDVRTSLLRGFTPFPIGVDIKSSIKEVVAALLGRRRHINKSVLSLHLLRNEAYYYVARNALEIICERDRRK